MRAAVLDPGRVGQALLGKLVGASGRGDGVDGGSVGADAGEGGGTQDVPGGRPDRDGKDARRVPVLKGKAGVCVTGVNRR